MANAANKYRKYVLVAIFCLYGSLAWAQNEVARERSSLRGVDAIGFTVTVEKNAPLENNVKLDVPSLQKMGESTLKEGGITLIPDNEVKHSDEIPFLLMHINTMDAGRGLIPFNISLYLYQPVKLTLNRDIQTTANTWESATLGLVSYDRLDLINKAAGDLLKEFIDDYNKINGSN
ncbi:MAG TPA: hypothetical protein VJ964_09550 [Balneolaceae bacterium]|nr:hypothetical protein [Balneolaceae bacterium]